MRKNKIIYVIAFIFLMQLMFVSNAKSENLEDVQKQIRPYSFQNSLGFSASIGSIDNGLVIKNETSQLRWLFDTNDAYNPSYSGAIELYHTTYSKAQLIQYSFVLSQLLEQIDGRILMYYGEYKITFGDSIQTNALYFELYKYRDGSGNQYLTPYYTFKTVDGSTTTVSLGNKIKYINRNETSGLKDVELLNFQTYFGLGFIDANGYIVHKNQLGYRYFNQEHTSYNYDFINTQHVGSWGSSYIDFNLDSNVVRIEDFLIQMSKNSSYYINCFVHSLRACEFTSNNAITSIPNLLTSDQSINIDIIEFPNDIIYTPPIGSTYWEYTSYKSVNDYSSLITIEDFSYNFQFIKGIEYNAYYFYNQSSISNNDFGDWGMNNWIRDGIIITLNLIVYIFQCIMYLITLGINYLILFILYMYFIPFLNNFILYYVVYALVFVLVYLYIAIKVIIELIISTLEWVWDQIVILWNDYVIPFFEWLINDVLVPFFTDLWNNYIMPFFIELWEDYIVPFFELLTQSSINFLLNTLLPWLVDIMITAISVIEALVLYLFSMGTMNLVELITNVKNFNLTIANFFSSLTKTFTENIITFLLYSGMYLLLVGFLQLKIIYCKSKGYVNRTNELEQSMNAYSYPIKIAYQIISNLWNLIAVW